MSSSRGRGCPAFVHPEAVSILPPIVSWMFAAAMIAAGAACAETFPDKPVRIVCGEPGGSTDFMARVIAPGLAKSLGQPVIVQNRGGNGLPQALVANALPDGYTLLLNGSPVWLLPFLQEHVSYDPIRDFATVTLTTSAPNVLVVHPSLPAQSVAELIALAKARPGQLNFGSSPAGSSPHLAAELFKSMAGINLVWVPYKSAGPALIALLGGEVQLMFATTLSAAPHVKGGRLRALAVTSPQPTALAPGLPTVSASGLPGYESRSMQAVWAPAKTPAAVVKRLNEDIVRALNQPDVKQKIFDYGSEVVGTTPAEGTAIIKADMARLGKVIKDGGIRGE